MNLLKQGTQQTPSKINRKRSGLHINIKLSKFKDKEWIIKAAMEKQVIVDKRSLLKGTFSSETMEARKHWHDIYKVLKENTCEPRILYLAKLYFKNERGIRTIPDKEKLIKFIIGRPALQEILKGVLQTAMKGYFMATQSHKKKE